jgi:hypothetical protein
MLCLTHLFFAGRQDGLSDRIGDDPTGKARRVAGLGSIGLTLGTREGSVAEHDALEIPDTNGVAATALIVERLKKRITDLERDVTQENQRTVDAEERAIKRELLAAMVSSLHFCVCRLPSLTML